MAAAAHALRPLPPHVDAALQRRSGAAPRGAAAAAGTGTAASRVKLLQRSQASVLRSRLPSRCGGLHAGRRTRQLLPPPCALVAPDSTWALWAALSACAVGGVTLERTPIGRALSAPVAAMLLAAIAANLGVFPAEPGPALGATQRFCVQLATPLLLFGADLRRLAGAAGRLAGAFALGAAGSVAGAVTGFALCAGGMRGLGDAAAGEGWKLAAALLAKNIGGGINYIAVATATGLGPQAVAAGLVVDNIFGLMYFPAVAAMAAGAPQPPAEPGAQSASDAEQQQQSASAALTAEGLLRALCAALVVSAAADAVAPGAAMPVATAITVVAASAAPAAVGALQPAGDAVGRLLLFVYFASAGAAGGLLSGVGAFWPLFPFCAVLYTVHLSLVLGLGPRLPPRFSRAELLLASNANIGGPATAASLAAARGWDRLLVPGMLVGHLGNAVATFLALGVGASVLARM